MVPDFWSISKSKSIPLRKEIHFVLLLPRTASLSTPFQTQEPFLALHLNPNYHQTKSYHFTVSFPLRVQTSSVVWTTANHLTSGSTCSLWLGLESTAKGAQNHGGCLCHYSIFRSWGEGHKTKRPSVPLSTERTDRQHLC